MQNWVRLFEFMFSFKLLGLFGISCLFGVSIARGLCQVRQLSEVMLMRHTDTDGREGVLRSFFALFL